ncbi:nucleotide-diphospho-sugar transferase [Phascolomyces articulosus]|uniref:glycogenin glucosyltransferase n=1 Tax=Phascolomyces articulosus TaxID=60185 RepID=A0AAD5PCM0_9FUNG|nr:nucleotide-diphospho-sugar transferase [Phascolomyces articulosus]
MTLHVYVTLVTTDSYVPGALVLAHRLRDLGTNKHLACLVTPNNVSSQAKTWLSQCFHDVISVDTIKNESTTAMTNLTLLGRPDLIETLTKLHVFRLTQYDKIVFLDADTYPIRLIDDLFERPSFSAAPDIGWPDCFNSGVFVVEPSLTVYSDLIQLASKKGSFDGGDQGLLNTYFDNWPETSAHRLPFTYNTTPSASYSYAPAYVEFRDKISVAHFIGKQKPWHYQRFADGSVYQRDNNKNDHLQLWWDTWDKHFDKMTPAYLLSTTRTIPLPHYHHYPLLSTPSTSNHPITSKKENVQSIWHDITSSSISSPDKNNFSNFQPIIKNQYHRQHYHHHYKVLEWE